MAKKSLIGAAAFALIAATSAAKAEGPEVTVEFTKWLEWDAVGGFDAWIYDEWDIKILGVNGWGVQLYGDFGFDLDLPLWGGFDVNARIFRDLGKTEIGVYAGFGDSFPPGSFGWGFGWDLEYESGRFTLYNDNTYYFNMGGFGGATNWTEIEFQATDRLLLGAGVWIGFGGGIDIGFDAWIEYDLGLITPYAYAWAYPSFNDYGGGIGVELEKAIGNGPFSLVGYTEVEIWNGGWDLEGGIGIRYNYDNTNGN